MSYSDTELHSLLDKELDRQRTTLSLIASENIVSETLLDAMGSSVVNKTVEGFPGQRYHAGCEVADELEELTISRARELFSAGYANVQPHSGTQANQAALAATARRGDRILSMTLADGGHLSHGARFNLSGVYYEAHHYSVDPATGLIDLDALRDLAKATRPAVLIAGASSYPRDIDYASFAAIAREVGAQLLVDIAHFAGLVAVGLLNDPVPYADVVTMSTYKGLRGPRGGLIVARDAELAARLRRGVFPFSQGTPAMNMIAAKSVCLHEALQPSFAEYGRRTLKSALRLADELLRLGVPLISGGTDTSMLMVDLRGRSVSGDLVTRRLESIGLLANPNRVPHYPRGPGATSGGRLSTAGIMSRGLPIESVDVVAMIVAAACADQMSESIAKECHDEIRALCEAWPLSARGARTN